jgi:hypothetical protein
LEQNIIPMGLDTYNINLANMGEIDTKMGNNDDDEIKRIKNLYWYPNMQILNMLVNYCKYHAFENVLEIGPGGIPFPLANTCIGYNEHLRYNCDETKKYVNIDIDTEKIPFENNHFHFTFVRHVIEDIQSPDYALKEILRTSNSFYIETPSPLVEICRGVNPCDGDGQFCGYIHHRYIVWSNMEKNTIYILPKFGLIENLLVIDPNFMKKIYYILNNFPVYWNTYFLYNKNVNKDVNIVMYKNDINMSILKDYARLIEEALHTSIESTNYFINNYKKYLE